MGEVYEVQDEELRVRVALKTLHPHLAALPRFAERFRQEIQLARQVTHPNVCRVFDAGRHGGTLFFTMELLEGETLARHLESVRRMPVPQAIAIALQLCEGLSAAHLAGILHRDFKSGNVIPFQGRAVITDFGLARALKADTSKCALTSIAVGTPAYMAPEQTEGGAVGPATDIYALGVVIYEMITGVRPGPNQGTVSAGLPDPLEPAILKCLARKPEDRFSDVQQLAAAIRGTHVRPRRLRSTHIRAALAATVVLAAGGGGKALVHYRPGLDDGNLPAHARLAEAYVELDMSDKAKDEIIHAATLAPDRSRLPSRNAQQLDAARFTVAREFIKAEQVYSAIAQSARGEEQGRAYLDVGRAAEKANHAAKAMEAYRLALGSSTRREPALLHLGELTARQGNRAQAPEQLQEAGQLFQLAPNFEGVTETRLELARLYQSSNLGESEALSRAAVEMAQLTGNPQQRVRSRFELSRVKLLEGHAGEATAIVEEAIAMAGQMHLDNLSVQGLNDMAAVFTRKLEWTEVEVLSLRAVELARRSRSRAGEARALFYLGQARMQQNDNAGALRFLSQAEPFYREGGDSVAVEDLLALKADVLCSQGRYAEAKSIATEMQEWGESHDDVQTLILAFQRAAEPRMFERVQRRPRLVSTRSRDADAIRTHGWHSVCTDQPRRHALEGWPLRRFQRASE